jgi:hypothetical protein
MARPRLLDGAARSFQPAGIKASGIMAVRMQVWGSVAFLLLAVSALAGCAGGSGASDGADLGLPALAATATTGVIRGVVVDEAIRPVANVTVEARGPEGATRSASTDGNGFFGFAALVPGTWFLTAEKIAYTSTQQSVEVLAGVDDPPATKMQVVFVPGDLPFYTEVKVEAFVQCIVPGANMCAIVNLYPCAVAGYCEPIVEDTSYVLLYDELVVLQRVPDWMQAEVVWESTQGLSPKLAIRPSAHSPDDGAGLDERQDWVFGASPIAMAWDLERAEEWEMGKAEGVSFEIFGHMDETSTIGSVGFVLNQRVEFFFHVFYGYTPPEGWQFSVDGSVPQPPT